MFHSLQQHCYEMVPSNCTLTLTNLCYNLESEDIQMPKLPTGTGNFGTGDRIT